MESNPCLEFFEANADNGQRVKALIDTGCGDTWATLTASVHSPGPVAPDEELARQLVNPVHWDDELEQPKLTFFDDVCNKGLSVNRLSYAGLDEIEEMARQRADAATQRNPAKPRTVLGLLRFRSGEIIDVMKSVDGCSGAVFDTAKESDRSHADVCQTAGGKVVQRNLRQVLFQNYKEALVRLAPPADV